jgi:hypothetical protein
MKTSLRIFVIAATLTIAASNFLKRRDVFQVAPPAHLQELQFSAFGQGSQGKLTENQFLDAASSNEMNSVHGINPNPSPQEGPTITASEEFEAARKAVGQSDSDDKTSFDSADSAAQKTTMKKQADSCIGGCSDSCMQGCLDGTGKGYLPIFPLSPDDVETLTDMNGQKLSDTDIRVLNKCTLDCSKVCSDQCPDQMWGAVGSAGKASAVAWGHTLPDSDQVSSDEDEDDDEDDDDDEEDDDDDDDADDEDDEDGEDGEDDEDSEDDEDEDDDQVLAAGIVFATLDMSGQLRLKRKS